MDVAYDGVDRHPDELVHVHKSLAGCDSPVAVLICCQSSVEAEVVWCEWLLAYFIHAFACSKVN